jgi:hypothetical protein
MHKIWRLQIGKNNDGKLMFSDIVEVDIDDETYREYNWDNINIWKIDEDKQVCALTKHKENLISFNYGLTTMYTIITSWDDMFNSKTKSKFRISGGQ